MKKWELLQIKSTMCGTSAYILCKDKKTLCEVYGDFYQAMDKDYADGDALTEFWENLFDGSLYGPDAIPYNDDCDFISNIEIKTIDGDEPAILVDNFGVYPIYPDKVLIKERF